MSVELNQIETTYTVEYKAIMYEHSYLVTRLEDMNSGYISYTVFDEEGEVIEGELEDEIVNYLEENID
jgi:hypothetical protein